MPKRLVAMMVGIFLSSACAGQTPEVFIPGFWDPQAAPPRTDTSTVRSIRFLTTDDFPPFHFALPDGSLAGFDIDLARAICEELKVSCTIQARRFDTLADSLDTGQGDALVAALPITAARRARLDFTAPYYTAPARFVAATNASFDDATPEAFKGKRVGVEAKTAHEAYLKVFFPETIIQSYPSQATLRAALRAGTIDALFGDGMSLSFWLGSADAKNCCAFRGGPFTESRFFGEGVGIAVKKNNGALRRALDVALAAVAARGTYTDLYLKYFPIGFY